MTDIKNTTSDKTQQTEHVAVAETKAGKPALVWVAILLTLLSWFAMMFSTGYVAMAVGIVAIASGFWAAFANARAMRKLAIAAIIAATVLVVVLAAFFIVIKIGLGEG